ncbi:MAG: hypothetical protein KKH97_00060 [Proteobacteria bacterium]|nr:hypothetical protein [Pseudomonadota bacterium]MBU1711890.1 hypothetical protein [Pseudomonadota bacterium]
MKEALLSGNITEIILMIKEVIAGLPWPEYVAEYKRDVRSKLDPQKVYAELSGLILMCW